MPIPTSDPSDSGGGVTGRQDFGGTASDFTYAASSGFVRPRGGTLTFWSAQAGGTRYTDLVLNGQAVTEIPVPNTGQIPVFQGPADVVIMWADDGVESTGRVAIIAAIGIVRTSEQAVADAQQAVIDANTERQAAEAAKVAAQAVGATTAAQVKNAIDNDAPTKASLSAAFVQTISPIDKAFGAKGDNATDDTLALRAAFTAGATFGIPVDLRGLIYRTSDNVQVPGGSTVRNGIVRCTGTAKKILELTGSNVTLERVAANGRHSTATASSEEYGVYAAGASAAAPLTNIKIKDCDVGLVGMYGIYLKHVQRFIVSGCDIGDLGYAGIVTISGIKGWILDNDIDNVLAGFSNNGYGIAMSRAESSSLTTDPRSADIMVRGNKVSRVPWEGIDTHGGQNLRILDNEVYECKVGIAIVGSDDATNTTQWAPLNVDVVNNTVDSRVANGSKGIGISIAGAPGTLGASVQQATGSVVGNTVRGHGDQTATTSGAIRLRDTSGMQVMGNTIIEPSPHGIVLDHDNFGFVVAGNTVIDHWSETVSVASAIIIASGYCVGAVTHNVHRNAGGKATATYKNERGYNNSNTTGVVIEASGNVFADATLPAVGLTATKHRPNFQTLFGGTVGAPGVAFGTDTTSGFYPNAASSIAVAIAGVQKYRFDSTGVVFADGYNMAVGATNGTRIGVGTTQKLGFWGRTPVVQPAAIVNATDAASAITQLNALLAAMRLIGLIAP